MREFADEEGKLWHAIAIDAVVAHGKPGAALAFVPADTPDAAPIPGNVNFNSHEAAKFALTTMGLKELRRRLALSKASVVGV
jgi:hypothetical protein